MADIHADTKGRNGSPKIAACRSSSDSTSHTLTAAGQDDLVVNMKQNNGRLSLIYCF